MYLHHHDDHPFQHIMDRQYLYHHTSHRRQKEEDTRLLITSGRKVEEFQILMVLSRPAETK